MLNQTEKQKKIAEEQKIDIKYFNIIYETIDFVEKNLSGLLDPEIKEKCSDQLKLKKYLK